MQMYAYKKRLVGNAAVRQLLWSQLSAEVHVYM